MKTYWQWLAALTSVCVFFASAPALAKQEYAAYEGADAVQIGKGGTRVTGNGIDYWTTGTPPRRFQVLGILTDARKDRLFDGNVVGSKSIANKTKSVGGDAVIIGPASTAFVGVVSTANAYASGNSVFGSGTGHAINRTTTQIIVIKYLGD